MSIVATIVIGFFVGLFARALVPGRSISGFIMTTLLGIGGAFLGKFIGENTGMYAQGQQAGFFMSLFSAMIILFIYQKFVEKTPPA
ncbi:MAG: GlsB/YeaQ/YmgE family stress response membrane protein [Chlamydiales bacterium]|nr:GlsB/YeaQ/YmgE family stress response membrane protein [Chlamydiales bacterium]